MPRSRGTDRLRQLGLDVLYFAVITPVGLCARAVRDPLRRAWEPDRVSYLEPPAGTRPPARAPRRRKNG
ncbi:hypothetical protein FRZ03_35420 [Streptomyces misionensis]|uniref:Uncharacterized protein n=1 Tax=Streptomyces misionensis TaxID=67331 RepID=A0A5C6IPL7_9ACTN|nr:hypothetical protein [Streptomyces misionensis]TWV31249.1 hypothetical protein FRZ03_35420 [Streptomyces misionensis]